MRIELEGVVRVQRFEWDFERDGKQYRVEYRREPSLYIRWMVTCWEIDREGFMGRSVQMQAETPKTPVAKAIAWHRDKHDQHVERPRAAIWATLEAIAREVAAMMRGETADE